MRGIEEKPGKEATRLYAEKQGCPRKGTQRQQISL
jgi:hypothetical protein